MNGGGCWRERDSSWLRDGRTKIAGFIEYKKESSSKRVIMNLVRQKLHSEERTLIKNYDFA